VKVDTSYEAAEKELHDAELGALEALSPETRALAEAAQKIIERPQGIEKRRFVGALLVRGYSPSAIAMRYYDAFTKHLDRAWLNRVHRKVHYSGKLRKISERQEELVLSAGLALKVERVQRLSQFVEAIEPNALLNPTKLGQEYRRGIQQIKEEVEGLGLDVTIHPADAWAKLLQDIAKNAAAATSATAAADAVEGAGLGTRIHDPEPAGDSS
jgi:hypothetical protein